MRQVETNQIANMITSLATSTDITVTGNLLRLKISGRNSPYKSHTNIVWETDAQASPMSHRVKFANDRYTLIFGHATDETVSTSETDCHRSEFVTANIPTIFLRRLFDMLGVGQDLPEVFGVSGIMQMPLVSVGWQRPRCIGFSEDGKPIFTEQEAEKVA